MKEGKADALVITRLLFNRKGMKGKTKYRHAICTALPKAAFNASCLFPTHQWGKGLERGGAGACPGRSQEGGKVLYLRSHLPASQ